MNHHATPEFWECYNKLPEPVQQLADKNYDLLRVDLGYPSLRFKSVGRFRSVRIGISYRALGVQDGETVVWFWIGSHDEYERNIAE